MKPLRREEDMAEMLAGKAAVLFIFVDWSEYASRGREVFEEAEARRTAKSSNGSASWWIADVSSTDSPLSSALRRWLTSQELRGTLRMFPNIAMGNGSVLWMKNGDVVGFNPSAERLGLDALVRRTEEMLADSYPEKREDLWD
jgi:hypothetical protein